MENQKQELSATESISLISDMVLQARFNVKQGSFHLIFWGILIAFIGLVNYGMIKTGNQETGWMVWLLTIPGFFLSMIYGYKTGRKAKISTYADGIFAAVWISFAVVMFTAALFLSLKTIHGVLIASFSMLLAGYATFLSGWVLKFTPLKIGGITLLIFSWIIYGVGGDISLLLSSLAVILGYVIPGILLRNKG